jgi:adenine phosphoribosyltransferase
MNLKDHVREVPDFPFKGILFRDITTLLKTPDVLRETFAQLSAAAAGWDFNLIAGPESRGFIFSVPLACMLGKGFIPVRKAGKLPAKTVSQKYALEYGDAEIEIHEDAIKPGDRVIIADDLLATGGTCKAACELIERQGGVIAGLLFVIELTGLNGRKSLEGYDVRSIISYS